MKKKNSLRVEIEWKLLKRIAEFYEFPAAVFLGDIQIFPKCKTRNESFRKKAQLYNKIKEVIKEEFNVK